MTDKQKQKINLAISLLGRAENNAYDSRSKKDLIGDAISTLKLSLGMEN